MTQKGYFVPLGDLFVDPVQFVLEELVLGHKVSCLSRVLAKLDCQSLQTDRVVLLFSQLHFQLCVFLTKCVAPVGQPLLKTVSELPSRSCLHTSQVNDGLHFSS